MLVLIFRIHDKQNILLMQLLLNIRKKTIIIESY